MAAAYPTGIASFISKVNVTDIIDASHPNALQEEVVATQVALGTEPNRSTTPSPSGAFNGASTLYSTVGARLNNIEVGVVADSHTQYLRKTGDSANVITIGGSTIKGLVVKGASSQSANLLEFQDSTGTVLSSITSAGVFSGTATPADLVVNAQTSTSYTLLLSDKNKLVTLTNSSAITLTVPLNSVAALPIGSQIHLAQMGAGQVTVSGTGIVGTPGLKLRTTGSSATLIKLGTDSWLLSGDLSA